MFRTILRRVAITAAVVAAGAALAGCGGTGGEHGSGHDAPPSTGAPQSGGTFNDADVAFATGMIPHHAQAVEMADLAATRASNAQVKALAAEIKKAQGPEITQMNEWLKAWGKPVPPTGPGHESHHGGMPGMMTAEDMTKLKGASGTSFDRMFLEMMIRHHEGAITMANTEKEKGADPEAKKLAETIATSQAGEITTMRDLLKKL